MRRVLCWLEFHKWDWDWKIAFRQWKNGFGYTVVCKKCRTFKVIEPPMGEW